MKASDTVEKEEGSLEFPFLQDEQTIKFLKASKVMIILRGLPGSGKSYIASKLKEEYPTAHHSDFYRYFEDEKKYFKFDKTKVKDISRTINDQLEILCIQGRPMLVIENTHLSIQNFYSHLENAKEYGYLTLVVEPKTSWKFDPQICSEKCVHNFNHEVIRKLRGQWKDLKPIYFGWFLNAQDSKALLEIAVSVLKQCTKNNTFDSWINSLTSNKMKCIEEFYDLKRQDNSVLHCTSKYLGRKKDNKYIVKVSQRVGSAELLKIEAFVITAKTFSCQLELSSQQLEVWEPYVDPAMTNQPPSNKESVSVKIEGETNNDPCKSGHITLGYADNVKAKQSRDDVTQTILLSKIKSSGNKEFRLEEGTLYNYSDNWLFILDEPLNYQALFTCNNLHRSKS